MERWVQERKRRWCSLLRKRAKRAIIASQGTRRFARLAQILRCAKNACSRMTLKLHHHLTASARAQLADYIVDERLGIPKEHQGPIKIVERIVNSREAGTHAAFYHHSSSRFVY